MSRIKAKIIGEQVWATENLSRTKYKFITGRNIPVKNENWSTFNNPKCFAYDSKIKKNKKEYLFDLNSVLFLNLLLPLKAFLLIFRTDCPCRWYICPRHEKFY